MIVKKMIVIDFTETEYDSLMMFIHLSTITNEYRIGELVNGVIEVYHLTTNVKGYIYQTGYTNKKDYYLCCENTHIHFGSCG